MTSEIQDWTLQNLKESEKFVATRKVTGVGDGEKESIVLDNPSDGTRTFVSLFAATSNGEADVEVTKNVNIDSSGTSITPVNLHVDGNNTSGDVTAEHSGTYSGGTNLTVDYVPGSGAGTSKAGGSTKEEVFLLEPGENARFSITNVSGTNSDTHVKLVWHEQVDV